MEILGVLAGVVLFLGLDPSVVVTIIAGIIIPILGFISTIIYRLHKRLRTLEKESKSREQVVYGGENNPLNLGLVKEIKSLKKDFEKYQEQQSNLQDKKQELSERIEALEKEIEKIGNSDDD